jgi:hypothetical protein
MKVVSVAVTVLVTTTVFRDLSQDPAPDVVAVGLEAVLDALEYMVDVTVATWGLPWERLVVP